MKASALWNRTKRVLPFRRYYLIFTAGSSPNLQLESPAPISGTSLFASARYNHASWRCQLVLVLFIPVLNKATFTSFISCRRSLDRASRVMITFIIKTSGFSAPELSRRTRFIDGIMQRRRTDFRAKGGYLKNTRLPKLSVERMLVFAVQF